MPTLDDECFAFSRFRLLPRQRTLTFDEDPVPVGSRGFEILRTLVISVHGARSARRYRILDTTRAFVSAARSGLVGGLPASP